MRKFLMMLGAVITFIACGGKAKVATDADRNQAKQTNMKTLHDFSAQDIRGNTFDFADWKGKKVIVVNTASKCGLTPQYEQLEELYQKYGDDNLEIVGFPANDFMSQEPGSDAEIAEFCEVNYGVSFLMMSKISVKGADKHPIYQWLTQKSENGVLDSEVSWNFQKFLVNEDGTLYASIPPKTLPNDPQIIEWIER
ncbi:MAG: glutathione peroxidase [Weeksellaceae bacterium]|nr:glutathione peroxidase [Weeksellaceae bacterium]